MRYLRTAESKPYLRECFQLAAEVFSEEQMFTPDEKLTARWHSPYTISSVALDDRGKVQAYFVWTITDGDFKDGLVAGTLQEKDLYVRKAKSLAILFFNVFVSRSPLHAPFMIRNMTRDLQALIQNKSLVIEGALSIASAPFTRKWLTSFGSAPIGTYQSDSPILYAPTASNKLLQRLIAAS